MPDLPSPIPPDHTVIFLHIPKTAGSTLHRIIKRQYRPAHLYHVGSAADSLSTFQQLPEKQRGRIRFLMGHFEMGVEAWLPRPSTYFTILRDPITRIASYYAHVRRDPDHYCHQLVTTQKMDLETFVRSGADVMVNNGQTRMIAGVLYDIPFGKCTPDILETAKHYLDERFLFVALTEQFDESLLFMQSLLGWRTVYYASRNANPQANGNKLLTEAARQAILEVNQLDMALYAFASTRFAAQITAQGQLFTRRLQSFQSGNRRFGPAIHLVDELLIRLFQT
jgi:hypothetical protein